jgi:hypothetical protein
VETHLTLARRMSKDTIPVTTRVTKRPLNDDRVCTVQVTG